MLYQKRIFSCDSCTGVLPMLTTLKCGLTAWSLGAPGSAHLYCARRLGLGAHALPRQMLGDWQSASAVHDVLHAFVAHTYGVQGVFVDDWQVPVPLQVRAGVPIVVLAQAG